MELVDNAGQLYTDIKESRLKRRACLKTSWSSKRQKLSGPDPGFRGFDPLKRVKIDVGKCRGQVLGHLLDSAVVMFADIKEARAEKKRRVSLVPASLAAKLPGLRDTDPWDG